MRYVPASGDPFSIIWIVGEAPGEKEVMEGAPFVGASGHELRKMLMAAGINPAACYITNVCHYRPPENNIGAWMTKSKKHISEDFVPFNGFLLHKVILEGIRELEHAIHEYKPIVVLALGNLALWALTGKWGIEQWRGSVMQCEFEPSTKVIPTYHPAYVLRVYETRVDVITDMRRARKESQYRERIIPKRNFLLNPSVDQVAEFLASLGPLATMDIETSSCRIRCIGIGRSKTEAMCIPISRKTPAEERAIIELLKENFQNRKVIGQNFLYDLYYLSKLWDFKPAVAADTMIAQGVLFPGQPKSLDYLASLYADDYCYWKKDHKEWSTIRDEASLWVYNCFDCCYTWEVWEALDALIDQAGQREQFDFVMSLYGPIHAIMLKGLRVDVELLPSFRDDIVRKMEEISSFLDKVCGHHISPHNSHQLRRFFYEDLRLPEVKNRKTGSASVDKESMEKLGEKEPLVLPIVRAIQRYRTLHILQSSVVESVASDGRLYTSLNPVGTVTFRFSSSENPMHLGTNLQNIAKKEDEDDLPSIRRLIIPDPGKILMEFDLSKADLRVVVWESGEQELKEALKKGINIYKDIAADVVRMPYNVAKRFVHGTNYGGSPRTMAAHCRITVKEAEYAQRRWFERFPGIRRWHERVKYEINTTRRVSNKFGFRMLFLGRTEDKLPEALAWGPQSTVAIVINHALLELYRRSYDILLQIHDSVLLQVPEGTEKEAFREIMGVFNSIVVPYDDPLIIPAECKVGKNWAEMEHYEPEIK